MRLVSARPYVAEPRSLSLDLGSSPALRRSLGPWLAAASLLLITSLTIATITDGPRSLELVGQALLVLAFGVLAVVDFRAAVAIAMLELAVAGSSGQWTQFPGGVHGRIVLDAIVMVRAAATLLLDWRQTGRMDLGRYGLHALILSVVMPGVWMTVGALNGNNPRDVFADGNGQIFFAFAVAFVVLIRGGYGPWLRRWLLVVCAVNAVVIGAIVAVSATKLVALEPTLGTILYDKLLVGNSIGYMPNGAYRLYLASGLYLQVGLALVSWELIKNPWRIWPWALTALLWVDVIATYTRGFWLGSALAVGLVVALGVSRARQAAVVAAGTAALFLMATVAGMAVGFSLPGYLTERAATSVSTGMNHPSPEPSPGAVEPGVPTSPEPSPGAVEPGVPIPPVIAGVDTSGQVSNLVRAEQARVLVGHIQERPILGWGFGTIAPDYRYGSIFSYELAFLDLWYKTGIVGLVIFLSFPLRLIVDAVHGRLGRRSLPAGVEPHAVAIVIAVIASILVSGATNPYFLAAFGLCPILAMIAWLDPNRVRAPA
jgi:hypothetical protein